jgi:hypothetical protein
VRGPKVPADRQASHGTQQHEALDALLEVLEVHVSLGGGHHPGTLVHVRAQKTIMPQQLTRVLVVGDEHSLALTKLI